MVARFAFQARLGDFLQTHCLTLANQRTGVNTM
jgi:hypothetical protein